ncbi:uncharacterized protein PGTG_04341 [Puccinia graminis f. sp. tritici CRL 75-36-700-3]|uniref:Uncharacterized protein n=2 Tax=Puccinia graminis f. sp. tritici TaxID=56615 RepID=E3K216_PUCGT|nr:uncharacterized protein PGTG_04341 [Puccinia graminis f. sp. tritici CRL 75-36-700-3]EFP78385.1 hypothetical protein PGTG_04341 [Puccinia graminis f. sp. tritici CRL 75-36-700-3]
MFLRFSWPFPCLFERITEKPHTAACGNLLTQAESNGLKLLVPVTEDLVTDTKPFNLKYVAHSGLHAGSRSPLRLVRNRAKKDLTGFNRASPHHRSVLNPSSRIEFNTFKGRSCTQATKFDHNFPAI